MACYLSDKPLRAIALVQAMACYQASDKPLPEPMVTYYCQLDRQEHTSIKFEIN